MDHRPHIVVVDDETTQRDGFLWSCCSDILLPRWLSSLQKKELRVKPLSHYAS